MRLLLPSEVTDAGSLSLKSGDSPIEAISRCIVGDKTLVNGAHEVRSGLLDDRMKVEVDWIPKHNQPEE